MNRLFLRKSVSEVRQPERAVCIFSHYQTHSSWQLYPYKNPTRLKSATATIPGIGTRSTQYSYDKSGLISQISQANNTTTTLSYDAAKRLSSIIHSTGNGAISSFNYGYDNHGNCTSQTEINGFGIENTSYSYNDLDQLLSVK